MKLVNNVVNKDIDWLHQKSEPVDMDDKTLIRDINSLLLSAYKKLDGKLQGLSAIQVGKPVQAILLRYIKGQEPIVVFNPTVRIKLGSKKSNEGCLSEGDLRYTVRRPILVKVSYFTTDGTEVTEWLPYTKARIFMHEYDHLYGILLQDKGKRVE